ncbi:hypothetical protein EII19_10515 [Comamonadaceae bacterium OH2310_COT-174]|nr:hypothetical protein EII19_10515 [Comamonadaceae bacterium OH2310_COT-174]
MSNRARNCKKSLTTQKQPAKMRVLQKNATAHLGVLTISLQQVAAMQGQAHAGGQQPVQVQPM